MPVRREVRQSRRRRRRSGRRCHRGGPRALARRSPIARRSTSRSLDAPASARLVVGGRGRAGDARRVPGRARAGGHARGRHREQSPAFPLAHARGELRAGGRLSERRSAPCSRRSPTRPGAGWSRRCCATARRPCRRSPPSLPITPPGGRQAPRRRSTTPGWSSAARPAGREVRYRLRAGALSSGVGLAARRRGRLGSAPGEAQATSLEASPRRSAPLAPVDRPVRVASSRSTVGGQGKSV